MSSVYLAENERGEKLAGHLKVAVYSRPGFSAYCVHDEPGYSNTFSRIGAGLFESLTATKGKSSEPRFADVFIVSVGKVLLGYKTRALDENEKKQRVLTDTTSLIVPTSTGVGLQDMVQTERLNGSGGVEHFTWRQSDAGELVREVHLARKGGGFELSGTYDGQSLNGVLSPTKQHPFFSTLEWGRAVSRLALQKKPFELSASTYSPISDPKKFATAVASRDGSKGAVQLVAGDDVITIHLDSQGREERIEAGSSEPLVFQRKYVRGEMWR
jgi:hypothetical protein